MAFTMTTARKKRLKERARNINEIRSELPEGTGLFDLFNELQNKFDATSGHTHAGTTEDSPQIPNGSLDNPNAYYTTTLHCSRQLTATIDPLFAFQMPFDATLVEASCFARASGGTAPTLTIGVEDDGVSVGGDFPISVTAGEGNISVGAPAAANEDIVDNSAIAVVATIGGTSPTWDDITVVLTFKTTHAT